MPTTKKVSNSTIRLPRIVKVLFTAPETLRLGVSGPPDKCTFVLVAMKSDGGAEPLAWGAGIPLLLRMIVPVIFRTDIGSVPVHMMTASIGEEDPDAWIDRNEKECTPRGFSAEQVSTDYTVDGTDITVVSVVSEAGNGYCAQYEREGTVASLMLPLQGYAAAYRSISSDAWCIWKTGERGSLLGRIENGKVRDVCHFWADSDALRTRREEVIAEVTPLLESVSGVGGKQVLIPNNGSEPTDDIIEIPGWSLLEEPVIPSIPSRYSEAYGNAIAEDSVPQLLPFVKRLKARGMLAAFHRTWRALRYTAAALLVLAAVAGIYSGAGRIIEFRDRTVMREIDRNYAALTQARTRRDALLERVRKQSRFIAWESRLTELLGNFQTVFPEGVKMEEMVVAERDIGKWELQVRAFAVSSSLMQPSIDRMEKCSGIHGARLVYSEQAAGGKAGKGIRFRIEADWSGGIDQ